MEFRGTLGGEPSLCTSTATQEEPFVEAENFIRVALS